MHGQDDYNEPRMRTAGSEYQAATFSSRLQPTSDVFTNRNRCLLTYKVYTQVDLTQLEGKMPNLKGFHNQEVPLPQQKTFHT